ncbi:MAG: methyltransferase domain-containing protein [Alphaproteobacteria bacterium]|nr:methyltransferase domain-containing protein [Alphaproteobacteria bacterium]
MSPFRHASPSSPAQNLYGQALALKERGDFHGALQALETCIQSDPGFYLSYRLAGDIFTEAGQFMQAVGCYAKAVQAAPGELSCKEGFVRAVQAFSFTAYSEDLKNVLLQCMETDHLDHSLLGIPWSTLMEHDPLFQPLIPLMQAGDYESFRALIKKTTVAPFKNEFFLEGLKRVLVFDTGFEKFLTNLRRALLENAIVLPELAAALSRYCLATDYVFYVSGEEKKLLQTEKDKDISACYELPEDAGRELQQIRASIKPLTPIENKISESVRAQYETFPYPRWEMYSKALKSPELEGPLQDKPVTILVAGCGTGREAIELAATMPAGHVVAVDLSLSSLSYAVKKAKEFGIENIEFRQADILGLGVIEKKFDYIACSGVLHHMEDPFRGWQVISGLLKPGGLVRVALYSAIARKTIAKVRKVITEKGYGSDADEIRLFRRDAEELLSAADYKNITAYRDYYNLPECRDLLFHVQEHNHTLPEIKDMLAKLELEFLQFHLPQKVIDDYRRRNPSDPQARNLDLWAKFENKNPDTFRIMYRFWCRKI